MKKSTIRRTRSVCPVCLKNIPGFLTGTDNGQIILNKTCPTHGTFQVPIWSGKIDFDRWLVGARPLEQGMGEYCPEYCGLCPEHENETCCVLLEITNRCNLHCHYCFAAGEKTGTDISEEYYKRAIHDITAQCGQPLLQLSGGEPTLCDGLPEMIEYAKKAGCSYTQINTNGIRLAEEPDFAASLAEAGLDIVFLQFDGTSDEIHEQLRGEALLSLKLEAIRICSKLQLGVILVPTIIKGVNDNNLGEIIRLARDLSPGVRGVHFQPVSFFGRYPKMPEAADRYTLDQLMIDISEQASIPIESFMPSHCDHPLCGFHADFLFRPKGEMLPLSSITHSSRACGCTCRSAEDNREYVANRWRLPQREAALVEELSDEMDFDTFLYRFRHHRITLSAMAFQDAMNFNIERLHRCSLHVYDEGKITPFCAKYLTAM